MPMPGSMPRPGACGGRVCNRNHVAALPEVVLPSCATQHSCCTDANPFWPGPGVESMSEGLFHSTARPHQGTKLFPDSFHAVRLFDMAEREWHLDFWIEGFERCRGVPAQAYKSTYTFDGRENYDGQVYGMVSPGDLDDLLHGRHRKFVHFVIAEGQFVRIMLTTTNHYRRLVALKVWACLVGRFCGGQSVARVLAVLYRLTNVNSASDSCVPQGAKGITGAFLKCSSSSVVLEQTWHYAMKLVEETRNTYFGAWAYDIPYCAVHGTDCSCPEPEESVDFDEGVDVGALGWEVTRENTPESAT